MPQPPHTIDSADEQPNTDKENAPLVSKYILLSM